MDRSRGLRIAGAARPLGALLALLALGACNPFVARYGQDPKVQLYGDSATVASQWNGTLAPPTAAAGVAPITGTVVATPGLDGATTYLYVSLASAPSGGTHPWQLRDGPCGADGAVVAATGGYGILKVDEQGRAAGSATVPRLLSPRSRYHVRVGASPERADVVVACGDLTPPTR